MVQTEGAIGRRARARGVGGAFPFSKSAHKWAIFNTCNTTRPERGKPGHRRQDPEMGDGGGVGRGMY